MSEPTLGVLILSCCFLVANRFAAGPAIVFGITNPALLKKRLLSSGKLCASVGVSISVETAMRAHIAGIPLQRRQEFAAARRAACSLEPLRLGVGCRTPTKHLPIGTGNAPTRGIYRRRGGTAYFMCDAHFETKSATRAILQLKGDAGITNPCAFDIAGRQYWIIYSIAFSSD